MNRRGQDHPPSEDMRTRQDARLPTPLGPGAGAGCLGRERAERAGAWLWDPQPLRGRRPPFPGDCSDHPRLPPLCPQTFVDDADQRAPDRMPLVSRALSTLFPARPQPGTLCLSVQCPAQQDPAGLVWGERPPSTPGPSPRPTLYPPLSDVLPTTLPKPAPGGEPPFPALYSEVADA